MTAVLNGAGPGAPGPGSAGSGDAGSGDAGPGSAGSGDAGSGSASSGDASSGSAGSYNPATTTAGGFAGECARLEAQAALTFDSEFPVLISAGLGVSPPGSTTEHRLLEIGAGSGAVTRRLRQRLPDATLYAIDINPDLLGQSDAADVSMVADAHRLPFDDNHFDSVLLRYVVQHLADPVAVLREVQRVLRPGGVVCVTDVDDALWGSAEPTFPELAAIHGRLAKSQQHKGGDRMIARRLTRLLREAGFAEVALTPFSTTNDARPTADFALHLGPGRLAPLVETGEISFAQFALVVDRWNRFKTDPNAWVMLLGFTAHGIKSPIRSSAREEDPS